MNVVYYGEELGMEDTEIPKSKVKDPWEKRVPGKKLGRDPERTPMQWGCGKNAGFTKGTPWLPVNQNHEIANVESELNQETSMLNFYKKLIKLRKTSRALQNGKYIPLKTSNKNVLAFARKSGNETIYVVLNFSEKPAKHSIGKNDVKVKRILSTYVDNVGGEKYLQNIELRGNEGLILIQDTN
jgi:alpha-glucosidase